MAMSTPGSGSMHSSSPHRMRKQNSEAHNIRIQIGKSDMKHSLSREYKPDMILLFYDFNNSSTSNNLSKKGSLRKDTISTPKLAKHKLADFVIKEETDQEIDKDLNTQTKFFIEK
jgi:hypothetical protein